MNSGLCDSDAILILIFLPARVLVYCIYHECNSDCLLLGSPLNVPVTDKVTRNAKQQLASPGFLTRCCCVWPLPSRSPLPKAESSSSSRAVVSRGLILACASPAWDDCCRGLIAHGAFPSVLTAPTKCPFKTSCVDGAEIFETTASRLEVSSAAETVLFQ